MYVNLTNNPTYIFHAKNVNLSIFLLNDKYSHISIFFSAKGSQTSSFNDGTKQWPNINALSATALQ